MSKERGDRQELAKRIIDAASVQDDGRLHILDLQLVQGDPRYASSGNAGVGFYHLRSLPPGLKVDGDLNIRLPNIQSLPDGLRAKSLLLGSCGHLKSLPAGMHITNDVIIHHCRKISHVPADNNFGKSLTIVGCPRLVRLPSHQQVGGSINLYHPLHADISPLVQTGHRTRHDEFHPQGFEITILKNNRAGANIAFDSLPRRAVSADVLATSVCPITLDALKDIDQVVFWRRNNTVAGADFKSFMSWWAEHGTDPETRQQIKPEDLFRQGN